MFVVDHPTLRQSLSNNLSVKERDIEDIISSGPSKKLIFPFMALMAGIMGGLFGIGGGMLISPLLLHVGIPPEVFCL